MACAQGIMATRGRPNPHLYQSMALLAGEMGYVAEARRWFREGTRALQGRCSHALWHGWAVLEAQKVWPLLGSLLCPLRVSGAA